jgi:hypothetical protein
MDAIFTLAGDSPRWNVLMDMISGLDLDAYIGDHQSAWCTIPPHWTVSSTIIWLDAVQDATGAAVQLRM